MVTMVFIGCSEKQDTVNTENTENTERAAWTINVEGVNDDSAQFTSIDAEKVGMVAIKATMKKKDGTTKEQEWEGISLKEALKYLGVEEFSTVVVEASDGYSKEYTPELVNIEGTILGLKVDGNEIDEEDGPLQLVVDGKGSNW